MRLSVGGEWLFPDRRSLVRALPLVAIVRANGFEFSLLANVSSRHC